MVTWLLGALFLMSIVVADNKCPDGWLMPPSGSFCLRIQNETMGFFEAEQACNQFCADCHLVSIGSAFDNTYIRSVGSDYRIAFLIIGLIDTFGNGTFQWIDGNVSPYRNWCAGSPTALTSCAVMDLSEIGCWRSTVCNERNASVCARLADGAIPTTTSTTATTTTLPETGCSPTPCTTLVNSQRYPSPFDTIKNGDTLYVHPDPGCLQCCWITVQHYVYPLGTYYLYHSNANDNSTQSVHTIYDQRYISDLRYYDYYETNGRPYMIYKYTDVQQNKNDTVYFYSDDTENDVVGAQSWPIPGGLTMFVTYVTRDVRGPTIFLASAYGSRTFSSSWYFNVTDMKTLNRTLFLADSEITTNRFWAVGANSRLTWWAMQYDYTSDIRLRNFDSLSFNVSLTPWHGFQFSEIQMFSFMVNGFAAVQMAVRVPQRIFVFYVGPSERLQSTIIYKENLDAFTFLDNGNMQIFGHTQDLAYFSSDTYAFNWQ